MPFFGLTFILFHPYRGGDAIPISAEILNRFRRSVADIFESSYFGPIQTYENHYRNIYATPMSDTYDGVDNSLRINYRFRLPLEFGNLGALMGEGIEELFNRVRDISLECGDDLALIVNAGYD